MDNDNIVEDKVLPDSGFGSPSRVRDWNQLARDIQEALAQGRRAEMQNAFREIQSGTGGPLLRLVRGKVPTESDAQDILARVYLGLYRVLEKPEPIANVGALLNTLAARRIADFWRQRSGSGAGSRTSTGEWRARETTGDPAFWERQADRADSAEPDAMEAVNDRLFAEEMVPLLLDRLDPELRDVLVKRHIEKLSVPETSRALGITEDMVKKRNQAGFKEARQIIEDETRIRQ